MLRLDIHIIGQKYVLGGRERERERDKEREIENVLIR